MKQICFFLSLYGSNGEFVLAVIDYYSRFLMVEIMRSASSNTILNCLRKMFGMQVLIDEIVTDHASYFISGTFKAFLHKNGINIRKDHRTGQETMFLSKISERVLEKLSEVHKFRIKIGIWNCTHLLCIIEQQNNRGFPCTVTIQ